MKRVSRHDDAAEDKKMFSKMLKKSMHSGKVASHLKRDIKEQKRGIKEDKKLMKSMHRKKGY